MKPLILINMIRKIFLITFLFFYSQCFASYDAALKHLGEARKIIKSGDKKNLPYAMGELKEARSLLLAIPNLNEEQESTLSEVSSLIYWQIKFGTINSVTKSLKRKKLVIKEKPKTKNEVIVKDKKKKKEWLEKEASHESDFDNAYAKALEYEKMHSKDYFNNLINWLNLHAKANDPKNAQKVFKKAKIIKAIIDNNKSSAVEKVIKSIALYNNFILKKDYKMIVTEIVNYLKTEELDHFSKNYLKQFYYETMAMLTLKKGLFDMTNQSIPFPDNIIRGYEGVITKVDKQGFHIVNEDNEKSFIGWEMINEEKLMHIGKVLIKGKTKNHFLILAFANVRLKQFSEAFSNFEKLIEIDNSGILQYKDFLLSCEAGVRLKIGERVDKVTAKALEMKSHGSPHAAKKLLSDLTKELQNELFSWLYRERIHHTYKKMFN